jgi:hypothetical protein
MTTTDTPDPQWIRRCTDRLCARHSFPPEDAEELASEAFQTYGRLSCPERTADEMIGLSAPV